MSARHLFHCLSPLALLALVGCSDSRFLPKTRSQFAGFEEQHLEPRELEILGRAKVDFQRARIGEEPLHARYARTLPYSNSRVCEGEGYEVTMVDEPALRGHHLGARIVLGEEITGDRPFCYDEIVNTMD